MTHTVRGIRVRIIAVPFGVKNLEWCAWLPDSEKRLRMYLVVSTEYRRVTDGQTDRHLVTAYIRAMHSIAR